MKSKVTPFTFEDTGIQVAIRKVSPIYVADQQAAYRREHGPKPPVNLVEYGNGVREETNYADPDYVKALEAFEAEVELFTRRLVIKRGVQVEMTDEVMAEVEELRKFTLEMGGGELDKDPLLVYVCDICTGTSEDLQDLLNAIVRRSQPTEEGIARAVAGFQG